MLMHEGCCTIKCGSMTCRNYDDTCVGGRILVMQCNVTITSHKRTKKKKIEKLGPCRENPMAHKDTFEGKYKSY